jgi:hypothetical protein
MLTHTAEIRQYEKRGIHMRLDGSNYNAFDKRSKMKRQRMV